MSNPTLKQLEIPLHNISEKNGYPIFTWILPAKKSQPIAVLTDKHGSKVPPTLKPEYVSFYFAIILI